MLRAPAKPYSNETLGFWRFVHVLVIPCPMVGCGLFQLNLPPKFRQENRPFKSIDEL